MAESADRIFSRLEPLTSVDETTASLLEAISGALGLGAEPTDEVARDTDTLPAWGPILDPDAAPVWALGWLAQLVGDRLLPSDSEADQRDRINQAAGFFRGTPRAIREEVARTLTGTKTVTILQNVGGDRWAMVVVTRTSETPDAAAAEVAARRQKPAGIVLTFLTTDDVIWAEATLDWQSVDPAATWASVELVDVT